MSSDIMRHTCLHSYVLNCSCTHTLIHTFMHACAHVHTSIRTYITYSIRCRCLPFVTCHRQRRAVLGKVSLQSSNPEGAIRQSVIPCVAHRLQCIPKALCTHRTYLSEFLYSAFSEHLNTLGHGQHHSLHKLNFSLRCLAERS